MAATKDLIQRKEKSLQAELEAWARENGVLGPGQQLVFFLDVESIPFVQRLPEGAARMARKYMKMRPEKFFTRERLIGLGMPAHYATRVCNSRMIREKYDRRGPEFKTMRDLVAEYSSAHKLVNLGGLGKATAENLVRALARAGMPI